MLTGKLYEIIIQYKKDPYGVLNSDYKLPGHTARLPEGTAKGDLQPKVCRHRKGKGYYYENMVI
ncbi:MAG: hypothetical protein ACTHKA_04785 [Anaerocolumna jejuensis]